MLKRLIGLGVCCVSTLFSAVPLGCASGVPLGDFQLLVRSDPQRPALGLRGINRLEEGETIIYTPGKLRVNPKGGAVTLVLAPAPAKPGTLMNELPKLQILEPKPANRPAEWKVPYRTGVVALVYGPQGVSTKKVKSFFDSDEDLIAQLADYAEKTAQTESLLSAITAWSRSSTNDVDAALTGFASQYGINNQIDRTLPRDQQTLMLMRSINPSLSSVDPVAQDSAQRTAQSAALATSVASIFFGTPVGLAASGGALAMNLRGLMFPNTEFRSSFALINEAHVDRLDLCGKRDPARARMRVAYLWATRVPNAAPPTVKIGAARYLPLGVKAPVAASMSDASWKIIDRARDWRLVSTGGGTSFPVKVKSTGDHKSLEIESTTLKPAPGAYRLEASWDWDSLQASGEVHIASIGDLKTARLSPESQDRLIERRGRTVVQLENGDFQFVEKAAVVQREDRYNPPVSVPFLLPEGKQMGPQNRLGLQIDTTLMAAGDYTLLLVQSDGKTYNVPMKVLGPTPKIVNLPLMLNAGELEQALELKGENLDRLAKLEAPGAAFKLGPAEFHGDSGYVRALTVELKSDARPGEELDLKQFAQNATQPAVAPGGVKVVGPRPQILKAQVSMPSKIQVTLQKSELPAGTFLSASLAVRHVRTGTLVRLVSDTPGSNEVKLRVGEQNTSGSAQMTSGDTLFLTFDPGAWPTGSTVSVLLDNNGEGRSKPYVLGKVVRVPQVDEFELTDDKADTNYLGKLTGTDLEVIAKVGWTAEDGIAVASLPAPVDGDRRKQSLEIALPWPPPSPRAPLWIWFRGDNQGRESKIRYGGR